MSERIHVLAQQILGKPSVADCSLQDLRNLVQRFPYFAPAQFLLLEKLKQENAEEYQAQLQKSVLYYHNPLAFEYFISSDKFFTDLDTLQASIEATEATPVAVPDTREEPPVAVQQEQIPVPSLSVESPAVEAGPEPLAFEPFHTVDYFASQGIKLSVEEQPQDKFGKQLKSFTEWLRTMKRLPAQAAASTPAGAEEKNVVHLAEDSVHEADVVTEAMAEVWEKQGNHAKAREVYNKLSLLNPSRKAYFAAKIENLKSS
jgi:hypothetical protein